MKRRILALITAFVMVVTMLPASAFAQTTGRAITDLSQEANWVTDRTEPDEFKIENGKISFKVKTTPAAEDWRAWHGKKAYTDARVTSEWKVSHKIYLTEDMLTQDKSDIAMWIQIDKAGTNGPENQQDTVDWAIVKFSKSESGSKWQLWDSNAPGYWVEPNRDANIATVAGEYDVVTEFKDGTVKQFINGNLVHEYQVKENDVVVEKTAPVCVIAQGRSYGTSYPVEFGVPTVDQVIEPVTVNNSDSLSEALTAAEDGDIINLEAGTYDKAIDITKSVTLQGNNMQRSGGEAVVTAPIYIRVPEKDVVIKDLKFEGGGRIDSTSNNKGTNIEISGCTANNINNTFVYTSGDYANRLGKITVKDNHVTNITGVNHSAFNLWCASEHEITGNYVENINFHAFNLDSTVGNVVFTANTIKNTGKGGLQIANSATGGTVTVSGNTFENVANKPYWQDIEENGVNYAAIRIYAKGNEAITSEINIENNDFKASPVSVWLSNRNTIDGTIEYYPVNANVNNNKFIGDESLIYTVYASAKNPIDVSRNFWGSDANATSITDSIFGNVNVDSYYTDETMTDLEDIDIEGTIISDAASLEKVLTVPGAKIVLGADIKLDKMLVINAKGVELDLNGHTITASDNFTGTHPKGYDCHVVNVSGDNVIIKNGTIKGTEKTKDPLNLYDAKNVVIENMILDRNEAGYGGSGLVVNQSTAEVRGTLEIITDKDMSWYAVDIGQNPSDTAKLTFASDAVFVHKGTLGLYGTFGGVMHLEGGNNEVAFGERTSVSTESKAPIIGGSGTVTDSENAGIVNDGGWYVGYDILFYCSDRNVTVSGSTDQDVKAGTEIDPVTYTAKSGYYFTSATGKNGIKAELSADKKTIKYSGTPNADTTIYVPSAVEEPPVIVYPVISRIAAIADQEYTGSAITPALTVYDTDGNIISSNNYTATYTNNVEPGTATVTVTGKAGVMGSATATFTIVKKEDPQPPQPEKPGKVEITKTSSDFGRIRVYFDKVAAVGDNTMRYQIQSQKVGSDVVKTQYATVGYSYATVRDLAYNAKYNIKIRAYYVDENGERIYGDWSEVKSVYANRLGTANQVMYKAGITKLTAGKTSVAVNLKKVAFTKNPVKITYQIAYKKKGATKFSYAYTTNLKKTVYNLSKNTNYQFKVRYYYKSLVDDKLVFSPYTALKTVKTAK